MTNPLQVYAAARRAADPLHDRAIVLGYNVSANVSGELFGRQPSKVSFWVRRFDQPSGTERTFKTVTEVSAYLDQLQKLPVYCLELEGNPRVNVTVEIYPGSETATTWITDNDTGQRFAVRFNDLEAVTRLCIHAESQPTIGNWEPA